MPINPPSPSEESRGRCGGVLGGRRGNHSLDHDINSGNNTISYYYAFSHYGDVMSPIARSREPWTREAVWKKLSAYANEACLKKHLARNTKNEKDIVFALKTARDFLLDDVSKLSTSLINSYYGAFWIVAAMVLLKNEDIGLENISRASATGHGIGLIFEEIENPLDWKLFIQRQGFMGFVLTKQPFSSDLSKIALPADVGKKDAKKYSESLFPIDDLMSRFPELSWHYELLTNRPIKCIDQKSFAGFQKKILTSKKADKKFIEDNFPLVDLYLHDEDTKRRANHNVFIGNAPIDPSTPRKPEPTPYQSMLSDYDSIAALDKPLDHYLIRHMLFAYAWSIIARYSPHHLVNVVTGTLSEWLPYLDEYIWFIRLYLPTECLNQITNSEWRFAPTSLLG